jgi:putative serine protease PepD
VKAANEAELRVETDRQAQSEPTAATGHSRPRWWLLAAVGAGVLVIGGVIGGFIASGTQSSSSSANACPATTVANKTLPSVVTISATSGTTGGTGSGEIIRSDGYILTNNHVISPAVNGGRLEVLFSDGTTASATLTGRDPQADLAVIKVNESSSLPTIPFDTSSPNVGEPVVVMGAPLGLSSTVTSGIVSALDRTVAVPGDNGQTALLVSAIQTDAAINPGNSGGAMTNCSGQLIGVPSAGATVPNESGGSSAGSVGLGFAIPASLAEQVANEIIETGTVTHAYFGIQVLEVPKAAAERAGVSQGLYVEAVAPGGPSANAGLQQGDIITEINGEPATDPTQLQALSITERAGDTVAVTYERNGQSTKTTITLAAQP